MSEEPTLTNILSDTSKTKKEMATIIKQNQKLQSELKTKNETINSLINQNFTELRLLHEKHDSIVNLLTTSYDTNIKNINDKYLLFKKSFQKKLKECVDTYSEINNERIVVLTNHNKQLVETITDLQNGTNLKDQIINTLNEELNTSSKNNIDSNNKMEELEHKNSMIENRSAENAVICDHAQKSYLDIQDKYLSLLNENQSKQNNIDEQSLCIIGFNSKISELEKKNALLEVTLTDANVKLTALVHQIDVKGLANLELSKSIHQLETEKEIIAEQKNQLINETTQSKTKLRELETKMLDQLNNANSYHTKAKDQWQLEHDMIVTKLKDTHEQQLLTLQTEYKTSISDREKRIAGLSAHLKSFTENQYFALEEAEKMKIINEKLQNDHIIFDQKINEISSQYKKEITEQRTMYKKEKDSLLASYNEAIKKSQELNDTLQTRLNQSIDTLSLSKIAITNLKSANTHLEKQLQNKETDDTHSDTHHSKIKNENIMLREKLERSIELNNTFSAKEKQYENQIRQLQSKYSQLVSLTKKNMSNSS